LVVTIILQFSSSLQKWLLVDKSVDYDKGL